MHAPRRFLRGCTSSARRAHARIGRQRLERDVEDYDAAGQPPALDALDAVERGLHGGLVGERARPAAGMGPDGGAPSAHSMALVKHEGVLYVFDPQLRATQPSRGKISPAGLRPLLSSFGKGNVRYLSGDLPAKDEKCRAGVLAFIGRLAADMGAELGKFEEMRK